LTPVSDGHERDDLLDVIDEELRKSWKPLACGGPDLFVKKY
jgi:hypothetical protein